MDDRKVLDLFVKLGYITQDQANTALRERQRDEDIVLTLMRLGFLDDDKLMDFYQKNIPRVVWKGRVEDVRIPDEILRTLPRELLQKRLIAPVKYQDGRLEVITVNPLNHVVINELRFFSKLNNVIAYAAPRKVVEEVLGKLYSDIEKLLRELGEEVELELETPEQEISQEEVLREASDAPIVRLAEYIIAEAVRVGASDIHIEPQEKKVIVRYRVDGVLRVFQELPGNVKDPLIARYKIMSNLDISEKRRPQDGRIRVKMQGKPVDLRVSTVPVTHGEKVVMRIQEAEKYLNVRLEDLGFEPEDLEKFRRAIYTPWGMVLVTGPTGSGKTTTLYAALMERNTPDVNIMTVEDPVEVSIPGLNQVQVNERIGLTFASVLRAFLRQDPDIILVGEIRDQETAEIGIRAALTGHLVFSTLHTNDAPSAVTRLVDMGIEPFLVGSSVILVVAQRLLRKLCPHCKIEDDTPREALVRMGVLKDGESITIYKARPGGCEKCNYTGYKGRTAVHEILEVDEELRKLIVKGGTAEEIRDMARRKGMRTLYEAGLLKVRKGITDLAEVHRVLAK
ncbi:type II secretion system protein E [Thermocrinis albus DSM 14484]|uniref:Type II secretion system protein E n=1 Tax=Thermocrinis albus (strain DSM 14484 / JCM 11386 / HI 11/12) TaxID=638303 RepID=D3SNL1_THEAH|nr:GspE/PulE family protein [Thermocrinis albus]ADC88748.1 type II secretion system protein E [Thermocrinis albus DSM 14484]